jgi:hypothetical protein
MAMVSEIRLSIIEFVAVWDTRTRQKPESRQTNDYRQHVWYDVSEQGI